MRHSKEIDQFWDWVSNNQPLFENLDTAPASALERELKKIDQDLLAQLDAHSKIFFVSPSGFLELLPLAEEIADSCPTALNFSARACLPRRPAPETVIVEQNNYPLNAFSFVLSEGRGLANISVAIPDFNAHAEQTYETLVFNLLDGLLGERDVMTKLGEIAFCHMTDLPKDQQALSQLPTAFDHFVDQLRNDLQTRSQLSAEERLAATFKHQRTKLAHQMGLFLDFLETKDTQNGCELAFMGRCKPQAQKLAEILNDQLNGVSEIYSAQTLLGPALMLSTSLSIQRLSGPELFKLVNELAQLGIQHDFDLCDVQLVVN